MNEARNISKMVQPTEQTIGRYKFYIYPLPAFTAANLSADVISLLAPLVGAIAGAFTSREQDDAKGETISMQDDAKGETISIIDMDVSEAAPYIAGAFSSLSADKTERLLRNLLINKNVAVKQEGELDADYLTEDKCNEIFCGNVQNMYVLAFYVIKVNYGDFFERLGSRSGSVKTAVMDLISPGMAPLT